VESVADNADSVEPPPPRSLGQTLAAERERQGLSRSDVAQRLHMSAYQIEAIETGDYSRLPRGTFLRGFVRNYAKILGVAADSVLNLLPDGATGEKKPGIVVPTYNIRFDPLGERLQSPYVKAATLAVVAVVIAFATMYWWLFIRPTATAARKAQAPAVAAATPQVVATQPAPSEAFAAATAVPNTAPAPAKSETKPEAKRPEPPKAIVAEAKKPEPDRAITPGEGSTLKFRFKGASWVEIRDAKGKLLLSKLNQPGSETEVSGRPPFNVIVGNAPEVQLFYNDHEFDLEPHTKVAVARFTVE
jgi:cytoskeleton protein RodZ